MPVWHEALAPWREKGRVEVVGIASEQHPERTHLFALWKELDWPILWDPFNLTGSSTVPNHIFVDEAGVVRSTGAGVDELESFLREEVAVPSGEWAEVAGPGRLVELTRGDLTPESPQFAQLEALSDLLWRVEGRMNRAVETLEQQAYARPGDPLLAFRVGVARRMRYDSRQTLPDDFQAAIEHWQRALELRPNQYVWRRRIQQYGPRMDKPYPFYDWIARARRELIEQGREAPELLAELTPAELAMGGGWSPAGPEEEPDPEGRILRDEGQWIRIESAAAFDTSRKKPVASVHLALRPANEPAAHWNNESGPMEFWIGAGGLGEGWKVEHRRLQLDPQLDSVTSREVRHISFEVELPADVREGALEGYVLFYACEDVNGRCLYMRKDFVVELVVP